MIPPLRLTLRISLVLTLFAATDAVAQLQPTELSTLDGIFSFPRAVNDIGQVVGDSTIGPGTARHAFLWTATSGLVDLGTLGGTNSVAFDVNDAGQIVGVSETTAAPHAFLWTAASGMVDSRGARWRRERGCWHQRPGSGGGLERYVRGYSRVPVDREGRDG